MDREFKKNDDLFYEFRESKIILLNRRTESDYIYEGKSYFRIYEAADECFFEQELNISGNFQFVDSKSYKVFDSDNGAQISDEAYEFLELMGVEDLGLIHEVRAILNDRYTEGNEDLDEKTYIEDLQKFISYAEEGSPDFSIFEGFFFLKIDHTNISMQLHRNVISIHLLKRPG